MIQQSRLTPSQQKKLNQIQKEARKVKLKKIDACGMVIDVEFDNPLTIAGVMHMRFCIGKRGGVLFSEQIAGFFD